MILVFCFPPVSMTGYCVPTDDVFRNQVQAITDSEVTARVQISLSDGGVTA